MSVGAGLPNPSTMALEARQDGDGLGRPPS